MSLRLVNRCKDTTITQRITIVATPDPVSYTHLDVYKRQTVATSVPNVVRGTAIILTSAFVALKPSLGIINSAVLIGTVTVIIALASLYFLEETFTKDLNYEE